MLFLKRRHTLGIAAFAASLGAPLRLFAQPARPLLMSGKKTLYQRVLMRPGAMLAPKPGAAGKAQQPFEVFYIYQRVTEVGKSWLQVGANADGKTAGYVAEGETVPWQHAMVLVFTPPSSRSRALFYRTREGLLATLNSPKPDEQVKQSLAEIKAKGGVLGPTSAVVAAEPENVVDFSKQFYMLPILEASTVLLNSNHKVRAMRVASVTADAAPAAEAGPGAGSPTENAIVNFNTGIVFVIDATSSMQPYIDRTRKAMEDVYNQIEAANLGKRIRFGVIAFQDDPAYVKGIEYLTRMFVDPTKAVTREQFVSGIAKVKAAPQSTRAFAEDGYAGVNQALREIKWADYGGRYVVYITDASAREANSKLASTHPSTDELSQYARDQTVAIFSVHLKTPEGKADHALAEEQYKRLSSWPGKAPNYFPIEAGDPARFEADLKQMVTSLVDQVRSPQSLLGPPPSVAGKPANPIAIGTALVGRAMVLAYLGRQDKVKAPPMYEAWISDVDPGKPALKSMDPRVLLNRNQLSDLRTTLIQVIQAGESGQIDPSSFFNQLRSAAVTMGRDPSKIGKGKAQNLQEAGLMGEYLEGLPYTSELMGLDLNQWSSQPFSQQQILLDRLKSRLQAYDQYYRNTDRWVKLNSAATDGEAVFPISLDSLP